MRIVLRCYLLGCATSNIEGLPSMSFFERQTCLNPLHPLLGGFRSFQSRSLRDLLSGNGAFAALRLPPNPHIRKYAAVCRLRAPCICTVSANIRVPRRICGVAFASKSSHTEVCCGLSASRALHLHRFRQYPDATACVYLKNRK